MSKINIHWGWFLGIVICGASVCSTTNCAFAQITPDGTLPNNSIVTPDGSTLNITGGTQAGSNLFHSFGEFSVPSGGTASFNNAVNIQNIIGRVTGGSASNIDGIISANGTANLFLINPSGIIFGQGARLNIGGSFVGTTASAIGFGDQGFFSFDNPNTPELLTVNPSALLFNQTKTTSIQNNSVADSGLNQSSEFIATGLRVPDGNSLLLVGGDINMDGGGLFAFGGRVELGGLAGVGTVELNGDGNNLSLSFPDSVEKSNILLSNGGGVYVAADDGGSITVNTRNLEIIGESFLIAGIDTGLGFDNSRAENIEVNATGVISLDNRSQIANQVRPKANGQGGDVIISANTFQIKGGAQVGAGTSGAGNGGNLIVDAQHIQLIGESAYILSNSGLFASAEPNSLGDAGDLTIKTNTLLVKDGAQVGAGTSGAGNGGNLIVDAHHIQLIGESAYGQARSGLFASAQPNSTGDAGDLTIKTNTLLVKDGAQVSTGTSGTGNGGNLIVDAQYIQLIGKSAYGQIVSLLSASTGTNSTGDAGDLTIKTNTLLVKDGAQLNTFTSGSGKGGNLTVDAQDIQLLGRSNDGLFSSGLFVSAQPNSTGDAGNLTIKTNTLLVRDVGQVSASTFGTGKGGNLRIDAQDIQLLGESANGLFSSGLFVSAQPNSTGDAGNLTIKTNTLLVKDGARITVQNGATGTAGNMTLNARSIRLNNNALLSADTRSAKVEPNREQATININSRDLIMGRNSNIFTNARGENVIGGNINIDTDILVGFENSDIRADSANFLGGNVSIKAQGIFGIQFRDVESDSTSDITATGVSPEFSGTVEINTPDTQPDSGLVNLPTIATDTEVAQSCAAGATVAKSQFTITGRGGLPPNPGEALSNDAVHVGLITLNPSNDNRNIPSVTSKTTTTIPKRIVEATGLLLNEKGEVVLTANFPTTPHSPWFNPASCRAS